MSVILTNIKNIFICSFGYKLVCVEDKFSKPFKSYLARDAVYNFISIMIKEDFENSSKCWICDNGCVGTDVKVRDHCHIR